jgi:hypothetical protein
MAMNKETKELLVEGLECLGATLKGDIAANIDNIDAMRKVVKIEDLKESLIDQSVSE